MVIRTQSDFNYFLFMNIMNRIRSVESKKLLEHICNLVENDFCVEMETLTLPGMREYTQEEAKEMAKLLARVYSYAHQIHCNAHDL